MAGHAEGEVAAIHLPLEGLRALLVAEAELGERLIGAMILRRVNLIQEGTGGPVMIGAPSAPDVVRLQSFPSRNGHPHHFLDPEIDWLKGCGVEVDRAGFVVTGGVCNSGARTAYALESMVPGVFAVGDVRSGSFKRVGSAIGEGAQVVAAIHAYLADASRPSL